MKLNRVLFVTQYFYPEIFRGNDIAFDLAKRGVEVTVVTAIPNYPQGRFFDGYGFLKKRKEVVNGVKIVRIPIVPRGSNSLSLILNYFSFAFNASLYVLFHCIFHKYDSCFVQQLSPVTLALPAVVFKKLTRKPVYTWVLDLWPESLKSAGNINNKSVLAFFECIVKIVYRHSDKILMSSKGFEESILEKGDLKDKLIYYPNWAEDVFKKNEVKEIPELPGGFTVMFAGNIGEAQDFDHLVEAAKLLKSEDNIRFVIIGDGRKKIWVEEQIRKYHLENVFVMLGRYPIDYMPSFFAKADVMLVSLKNELIFNLTAPAKIQAYMSVGKPIVAMMNGEGNALIRDANCGKAVSAESPTDLVSALRELKSLSMKERNALGNNGKLYCEENFDKEKCLDRLYELMIEKTI